MTTIDDGERRMIIGTPLNDAQIELAALRQKSQQLTIERLIDTTTTMTLQTVNPREHQDF